MPDSGARARRLASSLMSPFCPGKTLDACPSPRAAEWRGEIRAWAAEDVPDREILARLQARVPEFDLSGRPGAAWDWALPVGAMAVASAVLWIVARRARLRSAAEAARFGAPSTPDAREHTEAAAAERTGDDARLAAELAAFEPP